MTFFQSPPLVVTVEILLLLLSCSRVRGVPFRPSKKGALSYTFNSHYSVKVRTVHNKNITLLL